MIRSLCFLLLMALLSVDTNAKDKTEGTMNSLIKSILDIIRSSINHSCSFTVIGDPSLSISLEHLVKALVEEPESWGVTVFVFVSNTSNEQITTRYSSARKIRQLNMCSLMLLLSDDGTFLEDFAKSSLQERLLVWSTKLLVVTRVAFQVLESIVSRHWSFSMMNALFLNLDEFGFSEWNLYSYQPFSHVGAKFLQLAKWPNRRGRQRYRKDGFFPEKFNDFRGSVINVTALSFPPFWIEEEIVNEDGSRTTGTDGMLLEAVASALNFTFEVLPTASWAEVVNLVEQRVSFVAPVYHVIIPERLAKVDMSYGYEWSAMTFCMAKPTLIPKWQSLYYPFATGVWLGILIFTCVVSFVLYKVKMSVNQQGNSRTSLFLSFQEILGTLLGQNLSGRHPKEAPGRILVLAWLLFSFVLGAAYKGSLMASLTLPRYPPKAETVGQLVEAVDRISIGSYGDPFKKFFENSNYEIFRKLGRLLIVGANMDEELGRAIRSKKSAYISGSRYMNHKIAKTFTRADGNSELYLGREVLNPGLSAWPMPHDAPYKSNIDWCIVAVLEGGLYEKWSSDIIEKVRRDTITRQRRQDSALLEDEDHSPQKEELHEVAEKPLTLIHLQGPLILLAIGLAFGFLAFCVEFTMMS